jgi:rare lipoprotein A
MNTHKQDQDGPPLSYTDINGIKDAEPKEEAKSRSGNAPYTVFGKRYYVMKDSNNFKQKGIASWYGKKFHGRKTSSGEKYDLYGMTAAHRSLPLPTYVKVKNLDNGKTVIVKVNDRGPFHSSRVIDLSYAAASKLGIVATGTGRVELEAIKPAQWRMAQGNTDVLKTLYTKDGTPKPYLQAGAFSDVKKAQQLAEMLHAQTALPVEVHEKLNQKSKNMWTVLVGPLKDNTEIARNRNRVASIASVDPVTIMR